MAQSRPFDFENETAARLVAAAEELFAQRGQENVSLRDLTNRAGVNVAAVNYHFGSKEALAEALHEKLAQRISEQRREALKELSKVQLNRRNRRAHLEALLRSFIDPYLGEGNENQGRLLARLFLHHRLNPTEGSLRITKVYLDPIAAEYIRALIATCPHVPPHEFYWRYVYMVNMLIAVSADVTSVERIAVLSGGNIKDSTTRSTRYETVLRFLIGAFWGVDERQAPPAMSRRTPL
ncbi:TetR/AcrR family transcriptional regulator (plasmid) [Nitrobacteraceae bacterium UC4446_H13]